MTAKTLPQFVKKSSLQKILSKAKLLAYLHKAFTTQILSSDFKHNCTVMNLRDHQLVIRVNTAALATRLRYQTKKLEKSLNALIKKDDYLQQHLSTSVTYKILWRVQPNTEDNFDGQS